MEEESSNKDEFVQEKNEVMLFEVHLQQIFKEISSCVSLETFRELFGDIVKKRPSLLTKLHSVFVQELYDSIMHEVQLNEFVEEANLGENFSKRAKMIKENSVGEGVLAWRPKTGDVVHQTRSHDMAAMLEHKRELEEFVTAKEARVARLKAKVSTLRQSIKSLNRDIAASRQAKRETISAARRVKLNALFASMENMQNANTNHGL